MSGLRRVEWPWEFKRTCIPSNKKIGAARRAIGSQGGGARGPEKRGEAARQLAHLARLDAGEVGAGGLDPVVCRPLQGCFDDVRLEAEVVGGAARLDLPGLRALALLLGAARHFRLRLAREAARLLRREERFRERGRDRGEAIFLSAGSLVVRTMHLSGLFSSAISFYHYLKGITFCWAIPRCN